MSIIELKNIIVILVAHYMGDFVLQTTEMRKYKYDSIYFLYLHIIIYSATIFLFMSALFSFSKLWLFYVMVNAASHFIVDLITIRVIQDARDKRRDEIVPLILGTDQLFHLITLFLTFYVFDLFNF